MTTPAEATFVHVLTRRVSLELDPIDLPRVGRGPMGRLLTDATDTTVWAAVQSARDASTATDPIGLVWSDTNEEVMAPCTSCGRSWPVVWLNVTPYGLVCDRHLPAPTNPVVDGIVSKLYRDDDEGR